MIIKTVHLPFRFRDGQTIPMLKKNTIKRRKNHPMESYFLKQNLFLLIQTQPQLPSSRKTGFPPPFPDTNAHRLGFLHLTSKSVCKQEAAEVGGCETGKPEDRSANAPVEQKLDYSHAAQLQSYKQTCPSPAIQEKAWVPSSWALVTKVRPWRETMGFSSPFPSGQGDLCQQTRSVGWGGCKVILLLTTELFDGNPHTTTCCLSQGLKESRSFRRQLAPWGAAASKPRSSSGTYLWHLEEVTGKSVPSTARPSRTQAKGVIRWKSCVLLPETTASVSP